MKLHETLFGLFIAAMLTCTYGQPKAAEPLKVAAIETLTGPGSSTARLYAIGTKYALALVNEAGGWKGTPIQYLEYDTTGSTSVTAEKVRAAIADGAKVILQGGSSAIAGQIIEDVRKHNLRNPKNPVIYMNAGAYANEFTGAKCNFYSFKYALNAEMIVKALVLAMKAAGELGDKVFSINQNYSWGQDMEAAIERNAAVGGYRVVDKILHDVNKIQDFSPYVARIKMSGANTVISGNWSSDLVLLTKEISLEQVKVHFGGPFLELPGTLSSAGPAMLGAYHADFYIPEAGGAEAQALFERYRAKSGAFPTSNEVKAIFAIESLRAALMQVDPNPSIDVTKIALALESVKVKTPIGEMSMRREDHQAVAPLVVSIVSKDAKFKVDGTDMGLKPIKLVPGPDAIYPVQQSCKMQRPS